jgi:hypothetical protein
MRSLVANGREVAPPYPHGTCNVLFKIKRRKYEERCKFQFSFFLDRSVTCGYDAEIKLQSATKQIIQTPVNTHY